MEYNGVRWGPTTSRPRRASSFSSGARTAHRCRSGLRRRGSARRPLLRRRRAGALALLNQAPRFSPTLQGQYRNHLRVSSAASQVNAVPEMLRGPMSRTEPGFSYDGVLVSRRDRHSLCGHLRELNVVLRQADD